MSQGLVEWSDVVTKTRVRLFREVAARAGLSDETLRDLGVTARRLESVAAARGAAESALEAAQRAGLTARLETLAPPPPSPGGAPSAPGGAAGRSPWIDRDNAMGLGAILRRSLDAPSPVDPFAALEALGLAVTRALLEKWERERRKREEEERRRRERR